MARSARAAKPAKIKTTYMYMYVENFQIIEIETSRKQKYKHEKYTFLYSNMHSSTPKHERADNPFSENH